MVSKVNSVKKNQIVKIIAQIEVIVLMVNANAILDSKALNVNLQ